MVKTIASEAIEIVIVLFALDEIANIVVAHSKIAEGEAENLDEHDDDVSEVICCCCFQGSCSV